MRQIWHDLLFAHWPLAPARIRPLVPAQLTLDLFDGQCWIGVVPFWMSGVRARGIPPFPGLSRFPELNVRTYVTYGGKPGVYFFSLDAANFPAVWTARKFFHLPYFYAAMKSIARDDTIFYFSKRRHSEAEFRASYRPIAAVQLADKESLADWLTARYCLYTTHEDQVYRCEIHHLPWPLQAAQAEFERNSMAEAANIAFPDVPPLLHFSKRLEVLIWPLRRADQPDARV
jgi:uncharacterized protein YqjF (DUF2071 family)